jgi:sulfate adenylyltransferase subunit 1
MHNRIEYNHSELLRFISCGSVDDGKSTLIGRLLHDSKSIFEDQLKAVENSTRRRGRDGIDLSLLTDGLEAEREQGITIDVAYRYFATPKRKFIIADTPGHEQYTRNMATGASTANLAVILMDARKGVLTQSRRHAYIANLLRIPHLVVAVNKMDLVDYGCDVFTNICQAFAEYVARLRFRDVIYVPISALKGDMVVERGDNMPWYDGPALLQLIESIEIDHDVNLKDFRFPVQWVCRSGNDFRTHDGPLNHAIARQSVAILLDDDLDVSRGDMIVSSVDEVQLVNEFAADICWLDQQPLDLRRKYLVKHATKTVKVWITRVEYRVDVNASELVGSGNSLQMNDIARIGVKSQQPLVIDSYGRNRATGSFILIDEATNHTVAAGMIA